MRPLDVIAGVSCRQSRQLRSWTDADGNHALVVLDGFFAPKVVALVVVDVVHIRHRPRTLTVVVVGELEGLVLGVAVLDDVIRVIEQVTADDTELADGNVLTNGSNHCRYPLFDERDCSNTTIAHYVCYVKYGSGGRNFSHYMSSIGFQYFSPGFPEIFDKPFRILTKAPPELSNAKPSL